MARCGAGASVPAKPRAPNARERREALLRAHGIELRAAGVVPGSGRAKFHNVKAFYRGQQYDSAGEAEYAWKLDQMVSASTVADWERPKPLALIDCAKCGAKAGQPCVDKKAAVITSLHADRITYKPDFWVIPMEGASYYVDYKGSRITETAAWRIKVRLWKLNIGLPLRVAYPSGEEKLVCAGEVAAGSTNDK